ncbi:hypothetical protein GPECTOR_21g742 [Gonium pectorale]|uniref:RING-CH-type domain-containing protein n=1 Tax=Gonium pectorale TaxID=33097 RepID=A0A150GI63_GONPE|nr:hypothetical protein GPECTOR_21g742 [Gonium pectorale]|eukprot:KXZ49516.1 hypothetical protein GPECTOR_21g742 [Gonium pectorale]
MNEPVHVGSASAAVGWAPGSVSAASGLEGCRHLREGPSTTRDARGSDSGSADGDVCWLCLGGEDEGLGRLVAPCRCPRLCHPGCLSRWQLHCAGRQEEKLCRFCGDTLPDWRHVPPAGLVVEGCMPPPPPAVEAPPAYMRISYNGRSHKIRVRPGPEGTRQFIEDCRQLLKIPTHLDFDVVFHCKEPATQSDLRFRGLDAFDAAVYCASLANHAAAAAQQQQQQQPLQTPADQGMQQQASAPCPLPAPPPPPPRPLVRATSEMAQELARLAADALTSSGGAATADGLDANAGGAGIGIEDADVDMAEAAGVVPYIGSESPSSAAAFDSEDGDAPVARGFSSGGGDVSSVGVSGGGGGSPGLPGSLASLAAAVGNVIGAFRRCGSC